MSNTKLVHVVVIDDVCRFALHVLRYLGAPLGFGIGQVSYDDSQAKRFLKKEGHPKPILTEDGVVALWWLPAVGNDWKGMLEELLRQTSNAPKWFLIDLKGRKSKPSKRGGKAIPYDPKKVLGFLKKKGIEKREPNGPLPVFLVSSYTSGTHAWGEQELEIQPKSPETLWSITQQVRKEVRRISVEIDAQEESLEKKASKSIGLADGQVAHILVTGAGFEIRGSHQERFGLPSTATVLEEMGHPFGEGNYELEKEPAYFPYPNSGIYEKDTWRYDAIKEIADRGDLDAYWDFILEIALSERLERQVGLERMRKKSNAAFHEIGLREAFRRSLLKYDWGYINHNIYAARLNWFCWLTTNYTRFADRSIDLVQTLKDENQASTDLARLDSSIGPVSLTQEERQFPAWKVIGTANEARLLVRENLHGSLESNRCLFKLHGDIGHLHTMAMAGQDKETYSTLSAPIDSLHLLYISAQQHLARKLKKDVKQVYWHIIGHSLNDILLRRLISNVVPTGKRVQNHFIIVDLNLADPMQRLNKELADLSGNHEIQIEGIKTTAARYIANLFRVGFPQEGKLKKWLQSLDKAGETPK